MNQSQRIMESLNEWDFKDLEAGKIPLTGEERTAVMKADAIWHRGPNGAPSPAVWKSVVKGKTYYVTSTHRAYQERDTLDGAIQAYHDSIKDTA